ncbi:2-phosphosulfolactate phosphatase [Aquiflexum gelatinilyticum]|uniref:2-phosphosulfolactate phosphatase n=1 Tax=Aquiflexum gelatinilyticum TaxID=2961943 RepID=UPI00216A3D4E|nr:2-phosphosulfolactate phosphatase [Aquiflexum gelatinilyticum]MCS4435379.1 2-phosphosulfolactate phosphatase [Aquiflexum gelatinilyticum]
MRNIEVCVSPELIHLYDTKGKNVVIVDIFRATSTMMAALANGVESITPIMDLETCRGFASKGYVIAGERNGLAAEGFELGNSPLAYLNQAYAGKKIAMTTTNGTLAIEKTKAEANQVLIGAFVNLKATAKYLIGQPQDILILCAGWKGKFNLEDSLYAGALVSSLHPHFQTECDSAIALKSLYESNSHRLQIFLGQASHAKRLQNHNIESDIDFCLTLDIYQIVGLLCGEVLKGIDPNAQ